MNAYPKRFKPRREWYGIDLSRAQADLLKEHLKHRGIYFEPSEAYYQIHLEILMTEAEANLVNEYIERML